MSGKTVVVGCIKEYRPGASYGCAVTSDGEEVLIHIDTFRKVEGNFDSPVFNEIFPKVIPGIRSSSNRPLTIVMSVVREPAGVRVIEWGVPTFISLRTDLIAQGGLSRFIGGEMFLRNSKGHPRLIGTLKTVEITSAKLRVCITDAVKISGTGRRSPEADTVMSWRLSRLSPDYSLSRGWLAFAHVLEGRIDRRITFQPPAT